MLPQQRVVSRDVANEICTGIARSAMLNAGNHKRTQFVEAQGAQLPECGTGFVLPAWHAASQQKLMKTRDCGKALGAVMFNDSQSTLV